MRSNRPTYKAASWKLVDAMAAVGVACAAGYATPRDGKLYCVVQHRRELDLVPSDWMGYPVVAEVERVRPSKPCGDGYPPPPIKPAILAAI